ncbi:thioesterase domain-containing protein [Catellatospora tritici]|uniref:thioesterase domain-containing protein n=1 Tax=Catellatospora tritici TaxID=2851566 RepID=UPI001C2D262E|nr:thioesterase domain-containing protein [Catellatospora tritici]MBV1850606.1 hypothetical protein [Catellatospora tritici]
MPATRADAVTALTAIWEEILGVPVGPDDDFFDLGGYSLLVVDVVARARAAGLSVKAVDVFHHPTVAELAERAVAGRPEPGFRPDMVAHVWRTSTGPWDPAVPPSLVELVAGDGREPLFCVHLGTGHVRLFADLGARAAGGRPVYGFEAVGYRAPARPLLSIGETARRYLAELRAVQPTGPYHLAGLCAGAVIALEMAQQLRADGAQVASLILVDLPYGMPELDPGWGLNDYFEYLLGSLRVEFGLHDPVADLPKALAQLHERLWFEPTDGPEDFYRLVVLWAAALSAQEHYEPRRYDGPVTVIAPAERAERVARYWSATLPRASVRITEHPYMVKILADPTVAEFFREDLA